VEVKHSTSKFSCPLSNPYFSVFSVLFELYLRVVLLNNRKEPLPQETAVLCGREPLVLTDPPMLAQAFGKNSSRVG